MKKTSILTILIAFIALSSFAQVATTQVTATPEQRAKEATDKMKVQLKLNNEQYQKILAINKEFYSHVEAMKTKGQPLADNTKVKINAMAQAREDEINSILTAKQRTKLAEK